MLGGGCAKADAPVLSACCPLQLIFAEVVLLCSVTRDSITKVASQLSGAGCGGVLET